MDGMGFFHELRRRHVYRVAIVYAVTTWILLQLAAIVLPTFEAPHWVFKVLIGTFVICFPLALLLAWAFELTPEGVRRTVPAGAADARPAEQGRRVGRQLDFIIIAVLAVAVGVLAWRQFGSVSKPKADHADAAAANAPTVTGVTTAGAPATAIYPRSIAVLPFENLSADKNNAYFVSGMQNTILIRLTRIGGLTVIARSSTQGYASHPANLEAIARELGVANVLEGSVQKAGDQVLINVQLIDARNGRPLWAQSYQRTLQNIFGVEGEVAEKVAAALKAKLNPSEQARVSVVLTHNPAAYESYLQGLVLETNTSGSSEKVIRSAIAAYQEAVRLDPSFAAAWARLSSADSLLYFNNYDNTPGRRVMAKAALDQALALAPESTETQIALGDYEYRSLGRLVAALRVYRKALEVAPNSTVVLADLAYLERRLGHWHQAIAYQKRSLILDPRNVSTLYQFALTYRSVRNFVAAAELLRQALAISPEDPVVSSELAATYQAEGNLSEAATVLTGAKIRPRDFPSFVRVVKQALYARRYAYAIKLLNEAVAIKDQPALGQGSYYQLLGFAEQLAGNRDASQRAYTQAIIVLRTAPESPVRLDIQALAQAGLGKMAAALALARRAATQEPISRDAIGGPDRVQYLAMVETQVGKKAEAIATIKRLLTTSGSDFLMPLTSALLRVDPVWDPLRKDPAFQAQVAQPSTTPVPSSTAGTARP